MKENYWTFINGAWTCTQGSFIQRFHNDKRPFPCPLCRGDIKGNQKFEKHIKNVEKYKHNLCGNEFRVDRNR
jgi:hypothetical protein